MTNHEAQSSQLEPDRALALDFTALPLLEMALTLRNVGQSLLCNVLYGGCRPDWPALLPVEQARILAQPPVRRMSDRQPVPLLERLMRLFPLSPLKAGVLQRQGSNSLPQLMGRILRLRADSRYEKALAQAIAGKLPGPAWRNRTLSNLKMDFGGLPPRYMPDELWPVVSEVAWRDLDFQRWVAIQVRSYFQSRVLFTLGDIPVTVISPKTVWLLIALAGLAGPVVWPWSGYKRRVFGKAVKRLRIEGQRQALATVWAGFWDQWIISEALCRWSDAFDRLDPQLHDALLSLPLLAITLQPALSQYQSEQKGKADTTLRKLAAPDWEKEMPRWFQSLYKPSEQRNGDMNDV